MLKKTKSFTSKDQQYTKLNEQEGQKNIVVTHHAPSLKSVPDHYKDNVISAAYASNLENVIEKHNPRA